MDTLTENKKPALTSKDFASDQDVRWCPGCGDYSILAQTQKTMPDFGVAKEKEFGIGVGLVLAEAWHGRFLMVILFDR